MDKKKIERINELARKKKTTGLTEEETAEQGRKGSQEGGEDRRQLHPQPHRQEAGQGHRPGAVRELAIRV